MKPAPFEYHRPETVESAVSALAEHTDAELMAGNQSLGIVMSNRLATPDHIIDIGAVPELDFIEVNKNNVEIGATTTHKTIARSEQLGQTVPIFPEAAGQIAGPSVRSRGTLGGSLGEADPAGNYPTALVALDGTLHLQSADEHREVPAAEYFIAYMFTALQEDELITSVTIPTDTYPAARSGMAFLEQKPAAQTWPTMSAAAAVRVDDPDAVEPIIEQAGLTLANVADVPLRVDAAETAIEGTSLSSDALDAAADAAESATDPQPEQHADVELKTELAGEYTKRALQTAFDRARGDD